MRHQLVLALLLLAEVAMASPSGPKSESTGSGARPASLLMDVRFIRAALRAMGDRKAGSETIYADLAPLANRRFDVTFSSKGGSILIDGERSKLALSESHGRFRLGLQDGSWSYDPLLAPYQNYFSLKRRLPGRSPAAWSLIGSPAWADEPSDTLVLAGSLGGAAILMELAKRVPTPVGAQAVASAADMFWPIMFGSLIRSVANARRAETEDNFNRTTALRVLADPSAPIQCPSAGIRSFSIRSAANKSWIKCSIGSRCRASTETGKEAPVSSDAQAILDTLRAGCRTEEGRATLRDFEEARRTYYEAMVAQRAQRDRAFGQPTHDALGNPVAN